MTKARGEQTFNFWDKGERLFTSVFGPFKGTGTLKGLEIANLAILRKYIRQANVPVLLKK